MVLARECNEWLARLWLHVCGINHCQFAGCQTLGGNEVQDLKGIFCRRLVVVIIRNQRAAEIGGDDLSRFEVCGGKRRLATP